MELSIKTSDLAQSLQLIKPATDKKGTISILGAVLLTAGKNSLTISATDLELGAICRCPAAIKTPGRFAVPAYRFSEYVRMLPQDETIHLKAQSGWLSLACKRSRSRIAGMAEETFPELPKPPEQAVSVSTGILARLVEKVLFAISKDESRFTLNGALLRVSQAGFTMVATDGHRLSVAEHRVTIDGLPQVMQAIIPKKMLARFLRFSEGRNDQTVDCSFTDNHLFFAWKDRLLLSRKLTGDFPAYEKALPKPDAASVSLKRDDLHASIERVSNFADGKAQIVIVEIGENEFVLRGAELSVAESEESLPIAYTGKQTRIGFNAVYLVDFLKHTEHQTVRFYFRDEASAAELRPEGSDSNDMYRYVVMPMSLNQPQSA